MTAIGLSTAFAQSEATKTPVDGYSLENRLGISDQNLENDDPRVQSNQAKQLEGMLEALSGYGAAGSTVDIPFTLTLTNEDFEYADQISITFPAGFTINSVSNDDVFGPSFDNPEPGTGDPEPFNGIDGQTVSWGDDDNTYGGITPGATYTFTINVTTDGGVSGDQTVNYSISGDGFGDNPGGIDETLTLGAGQSVAGIVASSADHTTLEVAVDAAGLTGALGTTDPITLFAPTDAAFDALEAENPGIIEALLDDPAGLLTDVLLYHVAPVEAFSGDLSDGQMVTTLQGQDVTITIVDGDVFVNDVLVSVADLDATNGVVHVIDAVLLPPTPITLPVDFELGADNYEFLGFEGADSAIETNPDQSGVNTSETVMRSIKTEGAAFFAGTFVELDEPIDFSENTVINIDTWSPTADIPVRMALELNGGGEQVFVDVNTTVANEWETLSFDFTGVINPDTDYGRVVVFFEFIVDLPGDGSTYYFDNIEIAEIPSIYDIVVGSDVHNTLETAIDAAGLDGALANPDADLTLFAPTDDAFDALPDGVLDDLLADPNGALANVLLYHVVGGSNFAGDLMDGMEIVTAQGETVTVSTEEDMVFINDAMVTVADLDASNGVVHVIDAVLVPEFCTLFAGGPYTNFNTAFGGAPEPVDGICPYNAITGFQAWASEAYLIDNFVEGRTYTFSLSGGDVGAWDPYFLVIDDATGEVVASETEGFSITWTSPADGTYLVMIGEEGFCGASSPNIETNNGFPAITCESDVTVVDIIVASDDHNTLEAAVLAAELEDVLAGEGPFTVFAPTDAAFDALPDGLLDALLADPDGLLTEVLQHHVVGALAFSTDLFDGQMVPTLNGEDVTIGVGDDITVTSALGSVATVTVADIVASNGVVHVIDVVLAPSVLSVDELSSVSEFRMFPNPANNQVAVELQMTESEDLTIDVVNILGQNVKSFDFGTRSAGFNRELLDVNDLPEGMYILNITVGDDQATTKLQITR